MEAGQVPAGILSEAEPVMLSRKLWDGDHIIMVTDGVLDALPGEDKEQAMCQFLEVWTLCRPRRWQNGFWNLPFPSCREPEMI